MTTLLKEQRAIFPSAIAHLEVTDACASFDVRPRWQPGVAT
jgi:hypothetical protein